MCSGAEHLTPQAAEALADLVQAMAAALCPDDPGSVVVGPVDFGPGERE